MNRINEKKLLSGVCAGLASRLGVKKVWIIRLICLVLIWTMLIPLAYLILTFVLPDENGKKLTFKEFVLDILGKTENEVHFPISRFFLHGVTVLCFSTIMVGLIVILYSFTPVIKKGVDEPEMLEKRKITAEEVLECVKQKAPKKKIVKKVRKTTENNEVVEEEVEEDIPPMISLAALEAVLPDVKFSVKGRKLVCEHSEGYYEYGDWGDWVYPSRCYEVGNIDSKKATELRNKLQNWLPYDSLGQQIAVNKLAENLAYYQVENRLKIYNTSLKWMSWAKDFTGLYELWGTIGQAIGNATNPSVTIAPDKLFAQIEDFMENNPIDGREYLSYALPVVQLASGSDRLSAFKTMRKKYKDFDLNFAEWKTATQEFLNTTALHHGETFLYNLECYYIMYWNEGENRVAENARLQRNYEMELAAAETAYIAKKIAKRASIAPAGMAIGIAFGVFLLIAMILVLFSIQNTISRLEKTMKEMNENK